MHWKSDYSENNTLIARFVQTILEFLYLPILSNYSLSFNIINFLKENSKKTQRKQIFIYRSKLFLHFEKINIPGIERLRQWRLIL